MKVKDLIAKLQKMSPKAEVFISDEQGRYVPANSPYEADGEIKDQWSGEVVPDGSVIISFENT